MRVTFPAETAMEVKFFGPFTGRSLIWAVLGVYLASYPGNDHHLNPLIRYPLAGIAAAAGLFCGFWQREGVYLPTWIFRYVLHLLHPRRLIFLASSPWEH